MRVLFFATSLIRHTIEYANSISEKNEVILFFLIALGAISVTIESKRSSGKASTWIVPFRPIWIRPISLSGTFEITSNPCEISTTELLPEFSLFERDELGETNVPGSAYRAVIIPFKGDLINSSFSSTCTWLSFALLIRKAFRNSSYFSLLSHPSKNNCSLRWKAAF